MLRELLIFSIIFGFAYSLTCYNGMKVLALQSVGETTEECPSSSYCYNMSTSAMVMVNFVKAGCSTWRCMLAKDTCIFTTFQAIPVSLCCCSYDRCNVGGNPVFSDNPRQITGGNNNYGGGNNNYGGNTGGGSWGNGGEMNNNGWGNNNDYNQQQTYGQQNAERPGSGGEEIMTKQQVGKADSAPPGKGVPQMTQKQLEEMFKKSIDDRGDEIQLEGDFKKVDKNYKVGSSPPKKTSTAGKNTGKEIIV
ncbi:unnamed protein product [Caenorhabditis angaria]|uniref:Uncharacterized protein n=1 Tax=Caenorhabditis angaria TaxID=860376 RepID=A0A9P1MVI6_9PELO|nr:unnamed protein product [Caenorhabditis angaria]